MKRTTVWQVLVCVVLLAGSGCVAFLAGGAGAGTMAYLRGEMSSAEDVPLVRARAAARTALTGLGYPITSSSEDKGIRATFVARKDAETNVHVTVERITDSATQVKIRVGLLGDQAVSKLILDRMRKAF